MKHRIVLILLVGIICIFSLLPQPVTAQRYTNCDQCGLCITPPTDAAPNGTLGDVPGNWETCRACLYPATSASAPEDRTTMLIPDTPDADGLPINIPPTVEPGHYYTSLGCLTTDVGDFAGEGAAAGIVTPILNVLFSLAGGVALLYLMYGAFLVMSARGDVEQLTRGKRTIIGSIVGVIFVLGSVFIINLIADGVLKIPGFG